MKEEGKRVDPLKRLINDHEEISEYMETLEEIVNVLYKEKIWNRIKLVKGFFERNVTSHFKFEEDIVFPTILAKITTSKTVKLIPELQKEHEIILKDLEEFQKIISESSLPLNKETNLRIEAVGKRIIDRLLRHAAKEDDQLLPIMGKNRQIFDKHDII